MPRADGYGPELSVVVIVLVYVPGAVDAGTVSASPPAACVNVHAPVPLRRSAAALAIFWAAPALSIGCAGAVYTGGIARLLGGLVVGRQRWPG